MPCRFLTHVAAIACECNIVGSTRNRSSKHSLQRDYFGHRNRADEACRIVPIMGFSRRLLWLDIASGSRAVSIFLRFPEASMIPLSCQRIAEAVGYIDAEFLGTPQFEADAIGRRFGGRLVVKIETMNPVRSFKARGALFYVSQLAQPKHLVC